MSTATLVHGAAEVVAVDPPRSEWLELRRQGVGGSDVAAVLGLSQWRSAVAVWAEKRGEVTPDDVDSEAAEWGRILEAPVADRLASRLGLAYADQPPLLLRHPDRPHMQVTPDRIVVDGPLGPGVAEIKTTSAWLAEDWRDGATPDGAMLQAHWAAAVLGDWCEAIYIGALVGGQRLEPRAVKVNPRLVEVLFDQADDFWRLVTTGEMPAPIDGSRSTTDTLTDLFSPSEAGAQVELDPDAKATRDALVATKAQIKELEAERDRLANELRAAIGHAEIATWGSEKVATWKQNRTGSAFDGKAFEADHPRLHAQYVRPKPGAWVLLTPKTKAEKEASP